MSVRARALCRRAALRPGNIFQSAEGGRAHDKLISAAAASVRAGQAVRNAAPRAFGFFRGREYVRRVADGGGCEKSRMAFNNARAERPTREECAGAILILERRINFGNGINVTARG